MAGSKKIKINWALTWAIVVASVIIGIGQLAFQYVMSKQV